MDRRVLLEQVRILFEPLIQAILTSTVLAIALVYLQWHAIDHHVLLLWASAALLLAVSRIVLALMFKKENPGPERARYWAKLFTMSTATIGLVWGCASIWIMPQGVVHHQAVTIIALCGLAGGGVTTLSALRPPIMIFLSLLLLPLITHLLIEFSEFSLTISMLVVLYSIFLIGSAQRYYLNQRQNIVMRLESEKREQALLESETKLRLSEGRLGETQRLAHLGGWEWNIESGDLYWSDEIFRIMGVEPRSIEMSFEAYLDFVHPDDREFVRQSMRKALKQSHAFHFRHRIVRADGLERTVQEEGRVTHRKDGMALLMSGTLQDVTDQSLLEEQLRQSQKMEAIGTLVGGIAHDFNNMLGAIQSNIFIANRDIENARLTREKLENIQRLSERGSEMINQLLAFARKDSISMKVFPLINFMKEAFKLSKNVIPENIEYHCETCREDLYVKGDVTQLLQVLMNLISNACYAVSSVEHPRIDCDVRRFEADDNFRLQNAEPAENRFARISVSDNGIGISREHLDKVFEPFYTTKDVGEGTGLGLAMVYGAIQSHGGVIDIHSEEGKGTTVHIYLPLAEERSEGAEEEQQEVLSGESEVIILVDDEVDMLESLGEVLENIGYEVLAATDGVEAVELYRANAGRVNLIITDVVMPRLGGVEAVRRIRQQNPDIPVIFASGYDRENRAEEMQSMPNCLIISKPFSIGELSRSIRTVLGKE